MHLCCTATLHGRLRCRVGAQYLRHKKIKVMAVNPGAVRGPHIPWPCACPTFCVLDTLHLGWHQRAALMPRR